VGWMGGWMDVIRSWLAGRIYIYRARILLLKIKSAKIS
jgi:hypothetical protein